MPDTNKQALLFKFGEDLSYFVILGYKLRDLIKTACEVNFCRTFISNISLFLELAGYNLAQTLLNPPKAKLYGIGYTCKICLKVPKIATFTIESFPCSHSINAVLTGFNSTRQRIQYVMVL